MDLSVILVGAGEGRRMGGSGPKLLLDLGGRTLLERSAAAFLRHPAVGEIVAVVPAPLLDRATAALEGTARPGAPASPSAGRIRVVAGGATRQESVRRGLEASSRDAAFVAVHDVARPLVTVELIERVYRAARAHGAAIPALPIRDTVKEVADGRVVRSVPRDRLQGAQTPQVFARDILARAHEARAARGDATDDAALVEASGTAVHVVPGEASNVKITDPADLVTARALLLQGYGERD
ncbi:MAG TPA: 2-C-methyl-D-erythritol 4-phosphate cytidylyltransferase [Candidatus Eisenbacteria bacterium]